MTRVFSLSPPACSSFKTRRIEGGWDRMHDMRDSRFFVTEDGVRVTDFFLIKVEELVFSRFEADNNTPPSLHGVISAQGSLTLLLLFFRGGRPGVISSPFRALAAALLIKDWCLLEAERVSTGTLLSALSGRNPVIGESRDDSRVRRPALSILSRGEMVEAPETGV